MLSIKEKKILDNILEYMKGPKMPGFPVSKTKKINVPGFTNIRLKDESSNITGTHKDLMAREIVQVYVDILKNKMDNDDISELPHFSIISAGSAALAIQSQLKCHNLPNLKILVDKKTDLNVLKKLEKIGCEIYKTDLNKKKLGPNYILKLTNNIEGFDITSNKGFDPDISFYDRLAYEVLNENPDYVFIPFGTGQLYQNILNIAKNILTSNYENNLYKGIKKNIKRINFIGATTNNSDSKAVKLYAPFRPFTTATPEWIHLYAKKGYCGLNSKIVEVSEKFIDLGFSVLSNNRISTEHSGSAGLGALFQIKKEIPCDNKILIINTGKAKI